MRLRLPTLFVRWGVRPCHPLAPVYTQEWFTHLRESSHSRLLPMPNGVVASFLIDLIYWHLPVNRIKMWYKIYSHKLNS